MKPGTYFSGPDLIMAEMNEKIRTLSERVCELETALEGVLSIIESPQQSGPTICMSAEDAINLAADRLDLQIAAMGARMVLEAKR